MRHSWLINKCISCGLYRVKEGRGKNIYWSYLRHNTKVDYEKSCIPESQGKLFSTPFDNELLEECADSIEETKSFSRDATTICGEADNIVRQRKDVLIYGGNETTSRADVLPAEVEFEFDPDGKMLGEFASFKIFVISTIRIPVSLDETIWDTFPYAEDIAESFMKILPCRPSVLVCIEKNGKMYRAWRGMGKTWTEEM